jgi:hypothetical protein
VAGSVIVVDGPIALQSSAQVAGDVLGGDDVVIAPGARVDGVARRHIRLSLAEPLAALGVLLGSAAVALSSLVLGLLLLLLAPRGADRIAEAMRSAPLAAVGWGIAIWLVVPLAALTAIVTVVGIPVGLSALLALGLLAALGYTWTVWSIGRRLVPPPRGRLGAFLAGWGIGLALSLVPFLNAAWWIVASIVGVGAMLVAAGRARGPAAAPAAPPVPAPARASGGRGGRHRRGAAPPPPAPAEPTPPILAED